MIKIAVMVVCLLAPFQSMAADRSGTNEEMFEWCKAYEVAQEDSRKLTLFESQDASACVMYMSGAFQMYNFKDRKCDLTRQSPDSLITLYQRSIRSRGQLSQRVYITVGILMDHCFCGEEPEFAQLICPKAD